MWYWTLTKRRKIWQNIAFSRHVSFCAETSALAALQSQDKGFPHPAPKGTTLTASPRLICLRHWKSKRREKKQLEFEEAALEVCNLPWRAQWRWQRVLPVSQSCGTGILWTPLAAKAAQSLKKSTRASVTSWEMLSGSCTSPHPNGSLPTGMSPPNHSLGSPWCPAVTLPWWRRNHLPSQGWNWAGAGGHSLPHPGKNAAPTSTPWPESFFVSQESRRNGSCCFSKVQVRKSDSGLGTSLQLRNSCFLFMLFLFPRIILSPPFPVLPSTLKRLLVLLPEPPRKWQLFQQEASSGGIQVSTVMKWCWKLQICCFGALPGKGESSDFTSGSQALSLLYATKTCFWGSVLLTLLWALMLKWNLGPSFLEVFLGPSWVWVPFLWFDETKMLQEAPVWMLVDLRFVLNFWGFL